MRILRSLALALLALAAPLMRGDAQTCQGTAAFQDGRARVGVLDQYNSDFNDVRVSAGYGIPRSFYGNVNFEDMQVGHGGGTGTGFGADLGYQIHLSDTPFQVCPLVLWQHTSMDNSHTDVLGFGGSLGYRVEISDWFSVVPAAGVRWLSATEKADGVDAGGSPSSLSITQTSDEVFMTLGLVFNKTFTISPGVVVPSMSGAKSVYTLGVSINWANAVPR
jgi:hypothetical protein